MRKNIILLCSVFIFSLSVFTLPAQEGGRRMNMADFEKRKMEHIRKEAGLTQDEAGKFFPLNNELSQKKFDLYKKHRDKVQRVKENSNMSDEEYRKLLENDVDVKVKEAALEKEYAEKFEKVLSPEKLFRAQQAEKSFMQKEVMNFREERGSGKANRRR